MKILILVLAVVTLAAQDRQPTWDPLPQAPEKYPGQHEHALPPEGWFCERQTITLSVPDEHVCTCERMYVPETNEIRADKDCSVWCHEDRCKCQVAGMPHDPAPPLQP